jgi:hypothetical protein
VFSEFPVSLLSCDHLLYATFCHILCCDVPSLVQFASSIDPKGNYDDALDTQQILSPMFSCVTFKVFSLIAAFARRLCDMDKTVRQTIRSMNLEGVTKLMSSAKVSELRFVYIHSFLRFGPLGLC